MRIKIKRHSDENKEKHNYPNGMAFTLASCQSYKELPYLQSYESHTDRGRKEIVITKVNQQDTLYDARIQPKDLLSITVNTSDRKQLR